MINSFLHKIINNKCKTPIVAATLLAIILAVLPFRFVFSNIALVLFLLIIVKFVKHKNFSFSFTLSIPILLYFIMLMSLIWTSDSYLTTKGLLKTISIVILPFSFMFISFYDYRLRIFSIRIFSFGMVFYAILCFFFSFFRFLETKNKNVFLFHELVTLDVNAIYISYFSSLCLFYFIAIKSKQLLDFFSIYILSFFIILLSSKTIIFIDVLLLIWFYVKFSTISNGIKFITISMIGTFLFLSFVYVSQLQKRVIAEYQTAFVDNTMYNVSGASGHKNYNISIKQAWTKQKFDDGDFFPGTALRVFHVRLLKEIFFKNRGFFIGYGHEASEKILKSKYTEYKMFSNFTYYNFHNQFLQSFAEVGIGGFFVVIFLVVINCINAIKNNDFLHIVFAFSSFAFFLTESMLTRQRGILYFIVLYCIFNSSNKELNNNYISS